jgi:beta-xylosidase
VIKAMTNQAIIQRIFHDACSPVDSISFWNRRSIADNITERISIHAVGLTSNKNDDVLHFGK